MFDPHEPYTACLICGTVFQQDIDRNPHHYVVPAFQNNIELVREYATSIRKEWSHHHAKEHKEREHDDLKNSGRFCTPEAAIKLAAYGIINLVDAVMDNEVDHALRESKAIPTEDAQDKIVGR